MTDVLKAQEEVEKFVRLTDAIGMGPSSMWSLLSLHVLVLHLLKRIDKLEQTIELLNEDATGERSANSRA